MLLFVAVLFLSGSAKPVGWVGPNGMPPGPTSIVASVPELTPTLSVRSVAFRAASAAPAHPVLGLGAAPSGQYTLVLGSHVSHRTWHVCPATGFRQSPIFGFDSCGQLSHMKVHQADSDSALRSVINGPLPWLLMAPAMFPIFGCAVALPIDAAALGFAFDWASTTDAFRDAGVESIPIAIAAPRMMEQANLNHLLSIRFIDISFKLCSKAHKLPAH